VDQKVGRSAMLDYVAIEASVARNHGYPTTIFDAIAVRRLDNVAMINLEGDHLYAILFVDDAIVADREAFLKISIDQNQEFVWQPCLREFDEYSVDFSISIKGDISPLAFRRRIRSMDGFATLCEPGAPPHVREISQRVLERMVPLGARGPMNLQILRVGDRCWVSDLNPRAGTSMPLSLAIGLNPVAFLLTGEAGKDSKASESDKGGGLFAAGSRARTLRYLEERSIPDLRLSGVRRSPSGSKDRMRSRRWRRW